MIELLLLSLASVSGEAPAALRSLREEARGYESCIEKEALAMEPSGDTAETVLNADVSSCRPQRERTADALRVEIILRGETPTSARIERAFLRIDDEMKTKVLSKVLKQRAARR